MAEKKSSYNGQKKRDAGKVIEQKKDARVKNTSLKGKEAVNKEYVKRERVEKETGASKGKNDFHKKKGVTAKGKEIVKKSENFAKKDVSGKVDKADKKCPCPVASKCGGCKWIHKSYEEQLKEKEQWVKKLLKPYCKMDPIIGMEAPDHYRNKVHAVFGEDRYHHVISGTYEEKSHRIVPIDRCLIENQKADQIIVTIRKLLPSFKIRPYNEDTGYGLFRHALIRVGHVTGQIMVVLVVASPVFPSKNNFVKALLKEHPEITTIVLNQNDRGTSMVLGDKEHVLYGKGYIEDVLCGKTFRISAKSFYQVNPVQTEILYGKALEFAGLTGKETVLDAYCGTGTIGIIASDHAKKVIGVELNHDAVKDAKENAKINGVKNIQFYQNDAGTFLEEMASQGAKLDLLIMDPPRTGSSEEFLKSIGVIKPEKIVYVSCNPETLERDLQYLTGKEKYKVKRAVGVDMFPYTSHVETVVLLSQLRQKPDDYINVDVDVAELEGTSAETKATYEKIKKYVAEHNDGMKVSNLYIAQVKRKCGIELGENFNLPKSEDSRQPQCPKEKEEAILEALRAFQMI